MDTGIILVRGQEPEIRNLTAGEMDEQAQFTAEVQAAQQAEAARRVLGRVLVERLAQLHIDATAADNPAVPLTTMQIRQGIARTDRAIIDLVKLLVRTRVIDVDDATRELAENQ